MRVVFFSTLCLIALGCAESTDGDDGEGLDTTGDGAGNYDPDVDSYIPPGYRATDPQRVVFLGDSITDGVGTTKNKGAYVDLLLKNSNNLWPDHDEVDLESMFGEIADVYDVSQSGATSDTLVAYQLPDVSDELGDSVSGETLVVMTIGGNDMTTAIGEVILGGDAAAEAAIDDVAANMIETIDYFQDPDRFPDGAFVYFTNVYEFTDETGQADGCFFGLDLSGLMHHFHNANETMRGIAEDRGVAMVDMYGHFLGHGFHGEDPGNAHYDADDPTVWFADDCIHPNDRGHHELRRLFAAAIDGTGLPLE